MKKIFYFLLPTWMVFVGILTGCKNDNDLSPDDQTEDKTVYATSRQPVYISSSIDKPILLEALQNTFLNQTGLDNAKIAFIGAGDVTEGIFDYYNNGGVVVVCNVGESTESTMAEHYGLLYPSIPESSNNMAESEVRHLMLYGFDNQDTEFLMPWPYERTSLDLSGVTKTTDTGSSSPVSGDPDDEKYMVESSTTELPEYNAKHLQKYFSPLVEWVDSCANRDSKSNSPKKRLTMKSLSEESTVINIDELSANHYFVYPIDIYAYIDQAALSDADILNKHSNITGNVVITPFYASSANSDANAGDYYCVNIILTVHSGDMWEPVQVSHGGINNRIIGLYLESLYLQAKLLNADGEELTDVRFKSDGLPLPESNMGSSSHSESSTYGFQIGTTQGRASEAYQGNINVSFNASWTKSTTRELKDVQITRNTPGGNVEYNLKVCNIVNGRSWDNVTKDLETHYPEVCRSDLSFETCWIWFLPRQTHQADGVDDGKDTHFRLDLNLLPQYGAFNWWRGASWDNTLSFMPNQPGITTIDTTKLKSSIGIGIIDIDMPIPNRTRFGIIELKNMSKTYTLTNVKVKKDGDETVFAESSDAANDGETVTMSLPEGKYDVYFDFVDSDNNNIGTYHINDKVNVLQGATKESSTTHINSTSGTKI